MKAIIGLGNPETKYNFTRHNIGFMVLDRILLSYNIKLTEKFKSFFAKKDDLIFLMPLTYMNLSGEAVIQIVNFYKLEPKDLLIIYDDISLDVGTLRFRKNGSDGGHNGIKSIIKHLSSKDFNRLKVGVGPYKGDIDLANFVLQKFTKDENEIFNQVATIASQAAIDWTNTDFEHLQSKYNKNWL